MSEPNTAETKIDDIKEPTKEPSEPPRDATDRLDKNPPDAPKKSRPQFDPRSLFVSDPLLDQLERQVGLLTSAMTDNMVLATGATPDLTEGPYPYRPSYGAGAGEAPERPVSWANARSLHLRDAARLSFATASLVGAYAKLKGPPVQRFTTRHTIIPDPAGMRKPRKITTITHHLIASPDDKQEPERAAAHATQQG